MKTPEQIVSAAKEAVSTCTPADAAQRSRADRALFVLDVRESGEYEQAHLKVSVNVPRGLLEWKISSVCPDPDARILVHCATGGRAVLSAKTLIDMGYRNVTAVDGRFQDLAAYLAVDRNSGSD